MGLFDNVKMGNKKYKAILGVRQLDGSELQAYITDPSNIPKFTIDQDKVFTSSYKTEFTCLGAFYLNPNQIAKGWNGDGLNVSL